MFFFKQNRLHKLLIDIHDEKKITLCLQNYLLFSYLNKNLNIICKAFSLKSISVWSLSPNVNSFQFVGKVIAYIICYARKCESKRRIYNE